MSARNFRHREQRSEPVAQSYGDILRSTRENHGMTTREVARDLHVREDIISALEQGDFESIPPQGYSRNMIKSYSRLLGLDTNKMTSMFLDAEYSYRIGKERASKELINEENRRRSYGMSSFSTPRQRIEDRSEPIRNRRTSSMPRTRRESETELRRGGRALQFGDVNDHDNARRRLEQRMQTANPEPQRSALKQREQIGRQNYIGQSKPNNNFQFMNVYNGRKAGIQPQNIKLPIIVAVVVVLVVILILFLFMMGKHQENVKTDVSNIQVTGLTDPDKQSDNNEENKENADANTNVPTQIEFVYKVKSGQQAYMEIYENDQSTPSLARMVTSGQTDVFKCQSIRIVTTKPDALELTIGGKPIQLTQSKGVYTYSLTLQEYQAQGKTNGKRQ